MKYVILAILLLAACSSSGEPKEEFRPPQNLEFVVNKMLVENNMMVYEYLISNPTNKEISVYHGIEYYSGEYGSHAALGKPQPFAPGASETFSGTLLLGTKEVTYTGPYTKINVVFDNTVKTYKFDKNGILIE